MSWSTLATDSLDVILAPSSSKFVYTAPGAGQNTSTLPPLITPAEKIYLGQTVGVQTINVATTPLDADKTYYFEMKVIGVNSTADIMVQKIIYVAADRIEQDKTVAYEKKSNALKKAVIDANLNNNNVRLTITGVANHTINWYVFVSQSSK